MSWTTPDIKIMPGESCVNSVVNVKALVGAFNQEKALVGAFSVIVKTDESFAALVHGIFGGLLCKDGLCLRVLRCQENRKRCAWCARAGWWQHYTTQNTAPDCLASFLAWTPGTHCRHGHQSHQRL